MNNRYATGIDRAERGGVSRKILARAGDGTHYRCTASAALRKMLEGGAPMIGCVVSGIAVELPRAVRTSE